MSHLKKSMIFYLQLAISFVAGGLFIALQSLIGERVPVLWRGLVLTIPTTIGMGLLFVGMTKSPLDVVHATTIIPASVAISYLFGVVFAAFSSRGLAIGVGTGLAAWALCASLFLRFPPQNFATSLFLYGLPLLFACYFWVRKMPQVHTLKAFPINAKNILYRALLGGSMVTLAVVLAKTMGNLWGGMFSAFPASTISTLSIYYVMQGQKVIPAVMRTCFFPGFFGFIVYTWIASLTFPPFGIWIGTLLAYAATFLFFALYSLISKRLLRFRPDLIQ